MPIKLPKLPKLPKPPSLKSLKGKLPKRKTVNNMAEGHLKSAAQQIKEIGKAPKVIDSKLHDLKVLLKNLDRDTSKWGEYDLDIRGAYVDVCAAMNEMEEKLDKFRNLYFFEYYKQIGKSSQTEKSQ